MHEIYTICQSMKNITIIDKCNNNTIALLNYTTKAGNLRRGDNMHLPITKSGKFLDIQPDPGTYLLEDIACDTASNSSIFASANSIRFPWCYAPDLDQEGLAAARMEALLRMYLARLDDQR